MRENEEARIVEKQQVSRINHIHRERADAEKRREARERKVRQLPHVGTFDEELM